MTDPGPSDPIFITKLLLKYKKSWKHPWTYYFRIWESEIVIVLEGRCTYLMFWFAELAILRLWQFWTCNFEVWKIANLRIWQLGNFKVQIWTCENWKTKPRNLNLQIKIWKLENSQHPSTYRPPPLHPTTFADTMSSVERSSSELGETSYSWLWTHRIIQFRSRKAWACLKISKISKS